MHSDLNFHTRERHRLQGLLQLLAASEIDVLETDRFAPQFRFRHHRARLERDTEEAETPRSPRYRLRASFRHQVGDQLQGAGNVGLRIGGAGFGIFHQLFNADGLIGINLG